MTDRPDWLPSPIERKQDGGEWEPDEEVLSAVFCADFLSAKSPLYQGEPVRLKREPRFKGKEASFWHVTSEGSDEQNRIPDLRRCARLPWLRPIIEHADAPCVRQWDNQRKGERRACLWYHQEDFLLVLAHRRGYWLLWTAYMVTYEHTRRELEREWEAVDARGKG